MKGWIILTKMWHHSEKIQINILELRMEQLKLKLNGKFP